MRRVKQRAAGRRLRRPTAVIAVALLGLVAAGAAFAATKWPNAKQEIAVSGVQPSIKFCGSKPITLAVEDGFGVNAWSQESYAAVKSTAAQCKNVKVIAAAGGGVLSTAISDITSAVSQGANAITVIPDFGQAELPALQNATKAGVKVVPWGANPGGNNGSDYVGYVDWNDGYAGTLWANWMVQALHGHGNVIYTGGPAGNPVGADQLAAIVRVFANHPGMKLLTGDQNWPVTNWDPATAQTVTASLLSQYPKIDGIISNYGTDALASARAFQAAGRKLVPIATLDTNGLSCLYKSKHVALQTISSRNWLGRIAARKAIAAAEGVTNAEPFIYNLPPFEDTLHGKPYQCNPKASQDFYPSNKLTVAQIKKYGNAS
ncbi:MAG: substrate-binding domain-containing protein [Solirubrobacteraceae bacterium]